ncbi:MAG TPA: thioredoxin family protein [Methylibium sp.]|uniref:thioredoxin family protein n=1 Tax=Methylibium sp. TaxID=2067992 RepID=UPI002DBCA4CF|nr:thioredoxin family protein [Methylibium sp.]HEU4457747.1 thioredoxin family protein [Methylibium sp.]
MKRRTWLAALAFAGLVAGLAPRAAVAAGFPSAYRPMVVEPANRGDRVEFDLEPALQRARREGKRLYVYLGAGDCRFCRRYEAFLERNAGALVPQFDAQKYLVVDLRSALMVTGAQLQLKAGGRSLGYADFQRSIGDERARLLVYPNVWLFDADLKPLMQMPSGAGTFETVPEQLEILRLEQ